LPPIVFGNAGFFLLYLLGTRGSLLLVRADRSGKRGREAKQNDRDDKKSFLQVHRSSGS